MRQEGNHYGNRLVSRMRRVFFTESVHQRDAGGEERIGGPRFFFYSSPFGYAAPFALL
jgi:hypothetical protein